MIRELQNREAKVRATAAAVVIAEVALFIRGALTKRSKRQHTRARARGG